jgi:hypothetical protein
MKEVIDMDPRGEYYRRCPYCKEDFTAKHMNRVFCYEKDGKKDWCKNRYKRLVRNGNVDRLHEDYNPDIVLNACYLKRILNGVKEKIVEDTTLLKLNYNFDAYDFESPIHRDNFYSVIVENYALEIFSVDRSGTFYKIKNLDYYN